MSSAFKILDCSSEFKPHGCFLMSGRCSQITPAAKCKVRSQPSMWQAFLEKGSIISRAPKEKLVTHKFPQQAKQTQTKSLDVNLNHDVHWGKNCPFM